MSELSDPISSALIHAYRDAAQRVHSLSAPLSDSQFWSKPYGYGNSLGHLTLHIIGNLNYYIGTQIANTGYVRDRNREFTETTAPEKADVLGRLDDAVEMVIATLTSQSDEMWSKPYEAEAAAEFVSDRFSIFLRCATHFHHHVGQMIYLAEEFSK